MQLSKTLLALAIGLLITGCSGVDRRVENSDSSFEPKDQRERERFGTITGEGGVRIFGARDEENSGGNTGIGVNAFLWQASLETINFVPLASADPFGGLIITDWFQSVNAPGERLKMQVLIRDVALRADGVKVSVFRQEQDEFGTWLDSDVDPGTVSQLEDKILTRAREIRIERVGNS